MLPLAVMNTRQQCDKLGLDEDDVQMAMDKYVAFSQEVRAWPKGF